MTVIALDCNGVLADSVSKLAAAGIRWAETSFNIRVEKERAEEMVLFFSGETFSKGLGKVFQALFPEGYDQAILKERARELPRIIEATYREIKPYPEVIETLRQLEGKYHLVLSSTLKRAYLEIWLNGSGTSALFEGFYGEEDGGKEQHIEVLRVRYPQEGICFVGDSPYEMRLGDASIGVARQSWQRQPLREAGAKAVISSLDQLPRAIGLLGY